MGYGANNVSLSVAQTVSTEGSSLQNVGIALKGLLRDKGQQSYREQLIAECVSELSRIDRHTKLLQAQWDTLPQKTVSMNVHKRLGVTGIYFCRARWRIKTIRGIPEAKGRFFTSARVNEVSLLQRGLKTEPQGQGEYIWEQFLIFDLALRNLAIQSATANFILREITLLGDNGAISTDVKPRHYEAAATLLENIAVMDATNNFESITQ